MCALHSSTLALQGAQALAQPELLEVHTLLAWNAYMMLQRQLLRCIDALARCKPDLGQKSMAELRHVLFEERDGKVEGILSCSLHLGVLVIPLQGPACLHCSEPNKCRIERLRDNQLNQAAVRRDCRCT